MGKTSKPLLIAVKAQMATWPEVQKLADQGHTIHVLALEHDIVLGDNCWRMTPELQPELETAIKAARKVRYGTPSNAPDTEDAN